MFPSYIAKEPAGANLDRPLHLAAAYQQSTDAIKVLIDANEEVLTMKNKNGNIPLGHCILYNNNLDVISMLLSFSPPLAIDTELFDSHDNFSNIKTRISFTGGNFLNRSALHCVILRRAPW